MNTPLLEDKKILIVDDEPDVLETLEEILSMCRDLTKASSFEDARQLLETQPFDIAILDIMGVKGYSLLEIATKRNIMAVMLTAHALSPEHTIKAYKGGAAYYIPKDEMVNITVFLTDVLEAVEKGKSTWSRWLDRFDRYYRKKFDKDWKDKDKDFWHGFPYT